MNDPEEPIPDRSKRILIVWATVATLLAALFFNAAAFLYLRGKPRTGDSSASPFVALAENAVTGRYRWIEEGEDKGVITLQPDHSFINPRGKGNPRYRWEITRDAILIIFQTDIVRFHSIESSGVYVGYNASNQLRRMERIE